MIILNGGSGDDTMSGGSGDDTYIVDSSSDSITENESEGTDLIKAYVTYTASNIENLTLLGSSNIDATRNNLDNILTGNNGNNILKGEAGNDQVNAWGGNDILYGGTGNDNLCSDSGDDTIYGEDGNDTLASGIGNDPSKMEGLGMIHYLVATITIPSMVKMVMIIFMAEMEMTPCPGGAGDDTYIVDSSSDSITENESEGTDKIYSSATFITPDNVENLNLTGSSNIDATGNSLNNTINGNSRRKYIKRWRW